MTEAQTTVSLAHEPHDFVALGIKEPLLGTLKNLGYQDPTTIQRQAIPQVVEGHDLIGMAATGTGKTATYLLPLIQKFAQKPTAGCKKPCVLVLVPTRELASQVSDSIAKYSPSMKQNVALLYGGQSYGPQLDALKKGVTFVVGTPGRILDHLRRGSLDLSSIGAWVLDEADEMLDMGFSDDIQEIAKSLPRERQTLFFSATMPAHVAKLAQRFLTDPVTVKVAQQEGQPAGLPRVRQGVYHVDRTQKVAALTRLLELEEPGAALVFCRTRDEVDLLSHALRSRHAEALHGGLSQQQREKILARLRTRATNLVVATDVAARGLDIPHLTHVINYDFPATAEAYVHRIGRVGRAGREGTALSFAESKNFYLVRQVEKTIKQKIKAEKVPSKSEIMTARLLRVKDQIAANIESYGDLEPLRTMIASLKEEKNIELDTVAAVILAMKLGIKKEDFLPETTPESFGGSRGGERKRAPRDRRFDEGASETFGGPGAKGGGGKGKRQNSFERRQKEGKKPFQPSMGKKKRPSGERSSFRGGKPHAAASRSHGSH